MFKNPKIKNLSYLPHVHFSSKNSKFTFRVKKQITNCNPYLWNVQVKNFLNEVIVEKKKERFQGSASIELPVQEMCHQYVGF